MKNKKILLFLMIVLFVSFPLICQEVTPSGPESEVTSSLKTILSSITTIIGSIYVRILALAGLVMIGIKLIVTQNKQEFLKKVYGWIIACILVNLTPTIINKVFEISDSLKSLQTYSLFDTPSFGSSKKK